MGRLSKTVNLICPDYSKLLEEGIRRHLSEKELIDAVFNCNGNEIHAHRLIISIFIPDLMTRLESSTTNRLTNLDLNGESLSSIIEFIYSGRVKVASKELKKLKKDADMLEFELLVDIIEMMEMTMKLNKKRRAVGNRKKNLKAESEQKSDVNESGDTVSATAGSQQNQTVTSDADGTAEKPVQVKKQRPVHKHERLTFIRCSKCDFETPSESLYLKHLREVHGLKVKKDKIKITYRCYKCEFTTEDRVKWHTHRTIESRRGSFSCNECDKVFHYKILLDRHIKYNHSTDRPFHCDECEYKGMTSDLLKDHKKVHQNQSFKCPSCDMIFKLKSYLVRHKMQMHSSEEDKTFHCHICPKKWARRCDLNKHIRDVHSIQPPAISTRVCKGYSLPVKDFKVPECCHHCDFKPKRNKKLWFYHLASKHQEDVDGKKLEQNIKCEQCDRTFCIEMQLYRHKMKTHVMKKSSLDSEEKVYMCETCGHRTKYKHHLAVHRKTHSGDRFTCEICGKILKSKLSLKRHIGFMHNPNANCHMCHICAFATKRKSLLREHVSRMHKDRVEEPLDSSYENMAVHAACMKMSSLYSNEFQPVFRGVQGFRGGHP